MYDVFDLHTGPVPESMRGYNRASSMFELLQLGLPVLEGIIVTKWSERTREYVAFFLKNKGWRKVLIRSDKRPETDRTIRGGYLINSEAVFSETQRLLSIGRIVLLLEPADRYENLYGINTLISSEDSFALLEIVGPGFDVTDLNRGEISPHERIFLEVKDDHVTEHILNREIVDRFRYSDTVKARMRKIAKDAIAKQWIEGKDYSKSELETIGRKYLESLERMLLLESDKQYDPLPAPYLKRLLSYIRDLPWQLPTLGMERFYVISSSVIGPKAASRFVFWDIVRPSRKYQLITYWG